MKRGRVIVAASGMICIIISALLVGQFISYRNTIIEQQQMQLMSMVRFVESIIQIELDRHNEQLDYFVGISEPLDDLQVRYYLESSPEIVSVCYLNENGHMLIQDGMIVPETEIRHMQVSISAGEKALLWLVRNIDEDKRLAVAIDLNLFYERYVVNEQLSTKGYITIKNSAGYILMYPEKSQIGLHTLYDRQAIYPEFDLSEQEAMTRRQVAGERGVAAYHSYWWAGEEGTQRVKKISAFAPMNIGDDFWIISVAVDYKALASSIFNRLSYMIYLLVGFIFAFGITLICIVRIRRLHLEAAKEADYLRELNAAWEELNNNRIQLAHSQKLQTIGRLTSGIAHEFNNFLTPIVGYSALIMETNPAGEQNHKDAEIIYRAGVMAQELTGQISSLSYRETVINAWDFFDVEEFLDDISKTVRVVVPQMIKTQFAFARIGGHIYGSRTQIMQVVMNLISNAIYAMNGVSGYLKLVACTEFDMNGRCSMKLVVSDTGCGMDEEVKVQIFDPFFTTKDSGTGVGLGLFEVKKIIQKHNGTISVESKLGHGTSVTVCLPLSMDK